MATEKNIDELFDKAETQVSKELSLQHMVIPNKPVKDQKFVLIQIIEDSSFGSKPETEPKRKGNQILKIWGAFPNQESADAQAEQIKGKFGNELFDLFVLEMYGLANRPPNRSKIVDQKYNNDELQLLVDSKAEQKKKINERFDMRDRALENEPQELQERQNELKGLLEPINEETPTPDPKSEIIPVPTNTPETETETQDDYSVKQMVPPTHFDPEDKLHKHEEIDCLKKATNLINSEFGDEEFCKILLAKEEEGVRVDKQNWALVSFTGKNCKQRTDNDGIIFWGIFDKIDNDLKRHAQSLSESNMDIQVMELYTWIAIPPNPEYMKSIEVHEKYLLDVLKRHKLVYQFDKERFNYRKDKLRNNPDMNQFRRSKEVFRQLLERFGTQMTSDTIVSTEHPDVQNKEMYDKVFPKAKPLPKFEVVDETKL